MLKIWLLLLLTLLGAACATGYQPSYFYDGVHVVNDSGETLTDVRIEDLRYERDFSCGDIGPLGMCTLRFSQRRYDNNPLRISWTFGDAARRSETVSFTVPITFVRGITLRGIITVAADGSLSTFAEQHSPPR